MQTLWQGLRYNARMLMKKPGFALAAVITLALSVGANTALFRAVSVHAREAQSKPELPDLLDSPRLAALAREVKAGNHAALQQFWEDVKGKIPLVETIPENDQLRRVTFLWRGGAEARGAILVGQLPRALWGTPLSRGEEYRSVVPTPTILDNLVASKKIHPLVAILVDNTTMVARNRDLAYSAPFAEFVAKELVSWARQHYRLSADPQQNIVGGSSLGGLSAAYCAFRYPEVFGNVLSQSGAFWRYPGWNRDATDSSRFGWLTRQFVTTRKLPIRFYLEVGLFEADRPINRLAENRRLRDVLKAKGYTVAYSEFAGGHEYLNWRGSLADGLIALAGREKTGGQDR